MTLNELLEIVHGAYPEEHTRLCWDEKRRRGRMETGDTLAEFVVGEVVDTYEETGTDDLQLGAALDAMRWAAIELGAVIRALEAAKAGHKETGRPS